MKVLCVIAGLHEGGAERQFVNLVLGMQKEAIDVEVLIFTSLDAVKFEEVLGVGLKIYALNLTRRFKKVKLLGGILILWNVWKHLKKRKYDLIYGSLPTAAHFLRVARLFIQSKPPLVTSIRNDFDLSYSSFQKLLELTLSRWDSAIIVNSKATLGSLVSRAGSNRFNIYYVPNGVDLQRFYFRERLISQFATTIFPQKLSDDHIIFLMASRLKAEKNHLKVVRALSRVSDGNDWYLVIAGLGREKERIQAEIKKLNLESRIFVIPPQKKVEQLYAIADCLVLVSSFEGTPNVVLEALASEVPVIVSSEANKNIGVDSNRCGIVVDIPDDQEQLLIGFKQFLVLSSEKRKRMGMRGCELIRKNFSVKLTVDNTIKIFKSCLNPYAENSSYRKPLKPV